MADQHGATLGIGHPAPLQHRISPVRLYGALAAGPVAWMAQLLIGFAFPSYLCFFNLPRIPALPQVPPWLGPLLTLSNLAALAICALALIVSLQLVRETRIIAEAIGHTLTPAPGTALAARG